MVNTDIDRIERVEMDMAGLFWTRQEEMVEELEELDYFVTAVNWEYVAVIDGRDEEEHEYILNLGRANSTMWVERVRAMD